MNEIQTTYAFKWGYYITVYDSPYPYNVLETFKWDNMSFDLFCKYRWYFEYRYALLRVKYPKFRIDHSQLKRDLNKVEKKDFLRNRLIGKKRNITKWKNRLNIYIKSWNSLFPIEDDEPYLKSVAKIKRLEDELIELEAEMEDREFNKSTNQ